LEIGFILFKRIQAVDNKVDPSLSKSIGMIISSINIEGDWVYYMSESGVYKLKPTGDEVSKLTDKKPSCFVAVGHWIYAKTDGQIPQYYKLKVDGTNPTSLSDEGQITKVNSPQAEVDNMDKAMIKEVVTKYIQLTYNFDYTNANPDAIYSQILQLTTPPFSNDYKESIMIYGEDAVVSKLVSFQIGDVKISELTSSATAIVTASDTSHGEKMSDSDVPTQLNFTLNKVNSKWQIGGME
jgi:hypothetical protein